MKRIITFAAIALSAAFAFSGYEDWYTPAEDFKTQTADLTFWVGDKKVPMTPLPLTANLTLVEVAVDYAVENVGLSENAKNAFALGKRALSEAMFAQLQGEMNRQKIDSLGASVETIFQLTNADKVDSSGAVISSGKLADGVRDKMLAKKNALIGGGGTGGAGSEGGDKKPLQIQVTDFHYDTHEFEQILMNGNKSKMGLKGYKDLIPIISDFPFEQGLYLQRGWIPFSEGFDGNDPNDLKWYAWGGIDTDILDVLSGTLSDDGKVSLKDWHGGTGGCALNLKGLLTDRDSEDYIAARQSHTFLTRCKDGDDYKLHYLSVGDVIDSITPVPPDEATIETYTQEDGSTNIVLYASYDANDEAAESETELGFIPFVDGGETLAWAGFSEFFNPNVFTTDENGQIVLSGIEDAGEDDVMLVTAKGTSTEQEVKVKKLDGNAFEAMEGSDLTLRGFQDTSEQYLLEDEDLDGIAEVPVKVLGEDGFELEWRIWGGLDSSVLKADAETLHRLSLVGFGDRNHECGTTLNSMLSDPADVENRASHAFLARFTDGGEDSVHWVGMDDYIQPNVLLDFETVTTNSEDGAVEDGCVSLFGWAQAKEDSSEDKFVIPYASGENALAWADISEFASDDVFGLNDKGKLIIKGLSGGDANKLRLVAIDGGDESDPHFKQVEFDGKSITENSNSQIELANFGTRAAAVDGKNFADVMTNAVSYSDLYIVVSKGNGEAQAVKYLPVGKLAEMTRGEVKPIATDDTSITTNETLGATTANVASLVGWNDANTSATETSPLLPSTIGAGLRWTGILDFFSDSVFKQSETSGKILLNGTTEEGKINVLAITADGDHEQKVSSFSGDGISVDFGFTPDGQTLLSPIAQLHNFDNPNRDGAHTEFTIAGMLTNSTVDVDGWNIPVRSDYGVLLWMPADKIGDEIGGFEVDGKTVEYTPDEDGGTTNKLRIVGAKTAQAGTVPTMSANGSIVWETVTNRAYIADRGEETQEEYYPIYIYSGEDGTNRVGLTGWNTADSPEVIYGAKDGACTCFRMADIMSLEVTDTDDPRIEIAGYDDAPTNTVPVKTSEGLKWFEMSDGGGCYKFIGTDGVAEVIGTGATTNEIEFASETDSNVSVKVSKTNENKVKITLGVYWK